LKTRGVQHENATDGQAKDPKVEKSSKEGICLTPIRDDGGEKRTAEHFFLALLLANECLLLGH